MVLSKGRKIILIAATVIVVLAAAFFGIHLYRDAQSKLNSAIKPVLGGYALSFADPYDTETADRFIEEYWNPVKDKSSFHKKFVQQLQEQVIDLSFQNAALDSDDWQMNDFGEKVTNAQENIVTMMPFLQRVSYEDESLRTCLTDYYRRLAEDKRAELQNAQAESGQTQEMNIANGLLGVLNQVGSFNEAAADYYQIDENDIIPVDEISQHFQTAAQLAYDADDPVTLVQTLSKATQSPLLADQAIMDSEQIADIFIDDGAAIYTLRNGIGGYYDTTKIDASGVSYYGDFAARTRVSSSQKYDTSAFTPGLWSALTPGQQSEIRSGNSTKTYHYYYLLGGELDSAYDSDLAELAQSGYGYVYCNPDGSAMFVSANSATCYTEGGAYRIEGDFTELTEQAAAKYHTSENSENTKDDAIEAAITALLAGDYDTAANTFLAFSDNGTQLAPICQFAEQLAQSDCFDEGVDLIYEHLHLSEQDTAQLEIFLFELPQ